MNLLLETEVPKQYILYVVLDVLYVGVGATEYECEGRKKKSESEEACRWE